MKYKLLGRTGLRVSELCLGTMTFGQEWGWGTDKTESKNIFDVYANAGGNFIDTANRYTEGTSEKFVGEFIHSDRDHFVLATKYTLYDRRNDANFSGNHRKNLMRSVEDSLKRLNTDVIDVLYLHAWDDHTPIEEVLRGIDDLVSSGKIHYAGISDTPAWVISEANTIADLRGWTRFNALQLEYSLLERTPERDLMPMAKQKDLALTAWAPLAGGALTGKYLTGNDDTKRLSDESSRLNERSRKITERVVKIANEMKCSPAQVAIKWTIQNNPLVIPIIGARKEKQLQDSIGCLNIVLSENHMQELNELSSIDLGFPHEFLQKDGVKDIIFGGTAKDIINHRL